MLKLYFSKRYGLTTLLVIIACGVMIRLGAWQLDRLAQRQIHNAEIAQSLATPPLVLTGNTRPENLELRQFQTIVVRGVFDHSQEVALQNQTWQGEPGVHLITPLVIGGGQQAILVDRGWIPYSVAEPEHWANFQTTGPVEISGMIRMSQPRPNAPPLKEPELNIFRVDIDRLQGQISHRLLPVFIAQSPVLAQGQLPYRSQPEIQLTNGPHLGYAIQWFSFSVILAVGYVVFVRQHAQPARKMNPKHFLFLWRHNVYFIKRYQTRNGSHAFRASTRFRGGLGRNPVAQPRPRQALSLFKASNIYLTLAILMVCPDTLLLQLQMGVR